MSTPSDPQDGTDRPADTGGVENPSVPQAYYRPGPSSGYYPQYPQNPYGPGRSGTPPQYGAQPSGPTQFGQNEYGQVQYGQDQYGQGRLAGYEGSTYPYGGSLPIATGAGAAGRPRGVVTGFGLLLVPPVLFVLFGLVLALAPLTPDMFPPEAGIDAALAQSGLTIEQLLSALRTFGVVVAVLAVLYAVLAVVTFLGRFGALITLVVLTALFDLFWLFALITAAANPLSAILPLIVLGTSVAGVWLMFTPPARAWFAAKR